MELMMPDGLKDLTFTRTENYGPIVYTLRDTDHNGKFDKIIREQKKVIENGHIKIGHSVQTIAGQALEDFEIVNGNTTEKVTLNENTAIQVYNDSRELESKDPKVNERIEWLAREENKPVAIIRGHLQRSIAPYHPFHPLPMPTLPMPMPILNRSHSPSFIP
jgi:hypothetical protein